MSKSEAYKPSQVEPTKSIIVCNGKELEVFEIEISGEEYERCERQSTNMWANEKTGQFGSGLANSKDDPRKVERHGNFGELAFAKAFGLTVDFSYKRGGDEQDFMLLNKVSVNIKNAISNYRAALIRAITDKGYKLPMSNDMYVFSFTAMEDREAKQAKVVIVGWEMKENIIKRETVPARKGDHQNYDIPYDELKPISKLYNLYLEKLNHVKTEAA
jgi:hypothetical protein